MSATQQKIPLRVLIIEDSEFDARILVSTLKQGGYQPAFQRVETAETLRARLVSETWDVILSDYNMPCFSAPHRSHTSASHAPEPARPGSNGCGTGHLAARSRH